MKITLKDFIELIDDNTEINVYECKVVDGKVKSATKLNSGPYWALDLKIWPCRLHPKYLKRNVILAGNKKQSDGYNIFEILIESEESDIKYIRTKDGIYGPLKDNNFILKQGTFFGDPIINQSDSIEELCDYVWYKENHHEPMLERITHNHNIKAMKQPMIDGAFEYVRFMILVGKDLKTAAEMNEKGEINLLWL